MAGDLRTVELEIEGMSCAACAARIEKRLNGLSGVSASVNYATDGASVHFDPGAASLEQLLDAVSGAGYAARLPAAAPTPARSERPWRTLLALVLSVPV